MNKFEKIHLVKLLHLNTENSILIKQESNMMYLCEYFNGVKEFSIRTMPTNDEIFEKTPHYPVVKKQDLKDVIKNILNKNLYAIVASVIDPEDAELAGAAWINSGTIDFELVRGKYTVRRVTRDGFIDTIVSYPKDDITDERVLKMIKEVKKIPLAHCIVELSYYRIPVGTKQENVIIWDINHDGTQRSIVELQRLYDNSKESNEHNNY